ncbi:MAG: Fic family protein [Planctomycetota bacterium]|jgi:Fic family protein|nr:Fic family protein [Planctomycetota bacterium]
MVRTTGVYRNTGTVDEAVHCFIPHPLPPREPELVLSTEQHALLQRAEAAMGRLSVAASMVPSAQWFLYGFVRKEALVSSQIEGTQATFQDVAAFEATRQSDRPADVEEVCNYIVALDYIRHQLRNPKGLPISRRLLCEAHSRLLAGVRGNDRLPGKIRTTQNWIGGSRPGNARFVPPPPDALDKLLADLEQWIHTDDPLPPLVRAGLAHVQFETIHPFLDGNGRLGRMLITLLVDHWGLLDSTLLYPSLSFKRRQQEYYQHLNAVRQNGDWEGWVTFYLDCMAEAAEDGIATAMTLFDMIDTDRQKIVAAPQASVTAIRLFELLPQHPMLTVGLVVTLLQVTKPTAQKALTALESAGVLVETTGKKRDRLFAYERYLAELGRDVGLV